ncbi:24579_t:CDS:2 [Gigaspora margarita]|uniref:24579_t:CDS:1 n=1 Tax=Gigaspora margarita TaxID=4874 RepID=A0ABN7V098_GIGMA|nr:24579_t:CDS:2 [Gigaspora margarita]
MKHIDFCFTIKDFNLDGIEFQAIPSGLHAVRQDIMPPYVGLSVFLNESTMDESHDRGAHMAAVGILVSPTAETGLCGRPWKHLGFLRDEVVRYVHFSNDYSSLRQYFEKHSIRPDFLENNSDSTEPYGNSTISRRPRAFTISSSRGLSTETGISSYSVPVPSTHPAHHFPEFVRLCGPTIFILWKASLLKKRILFYSPPPVEDICYSVYGTCLLANIPSTITRSLKNKVDKIKPLFSVGINDIPMIQSTENGYVACTTDRILQHKNNLYDLLVNMPVRESNHSHPTLVASPGSHLSTNINATDIRRYRVLLKILASYGVNFLDGYEEDGGNLTDTWRKMMFGGWFWWYGRDGYQKLSDDYGGEGEEEGDVLLSYHDEPSQDAQNVDGSKDISEIESDDEITFLYSDHLIQLGLDPRDDGAFVEELAEMYFGKEVEVVGKGGNILIQSCSELCSLDELCCCCRA